MQTSRRTPRNFETIPASERDDMVSLATLGRLLGELKPQVGVICSQAECCEPAICSAGSRALYSLCERHAHSAELIIALPGS